MAKRAEDRRFHFTYKVTCLKTEKVFYGLHSTDDIDRKFEGKGASLYMSFKNHGREAHKLELLQLYPSRKEAKIAYNDLKATELANPSRPEDRKYHVVYKTTRFDGKYYIGVHSTDNLGDGYKGSGAYIARSLKKHGWAKHNCEILETCESRDHAFKREEEIVTPELMRDPLCMNKIPGGRHHGGRVYGLTEETRRKIGVKSAATPRTPEWRAKIGAAHKGKTQPKEAVEKHRKKMTGYTWTAEQIAARTAGQLASEKFKKRYRPIIVDGVAYQNGREATAALGIPGGTLVNRLNSPNWLGYRYADAPEKNPALASARARGAYRRPSPGMN